MNLINLNYFDEAAFVRNNPNQEAQAKEQKKPDIVKQYTVIARYAITEAGYYYEEFCQHESKFSEIDLYLYNTKQNKPMNEIPGTNAHSSIIAIKENERKLALGLSATKQNGRYNDNSKTPDNKRKAQLSLNLRNDLRLAIESSGSQLAPFINQAIEEKLIKDNLI